MALNNTDPKAFSLKVLELVYRYITFALALNLSVKSAFKFKRAVFLKKFDL
ncbi:hypothetical protein D3C86_911880 [compost metagenome]